MILFRLLLGFSGTIVSARDDLPPFWTLQSVRVPFIRRFLLGSESASRGSDADRLAALDSGSEPLELKGVNELFVVAIRAFLQFWPSM